MISLFKSLKPPPNKSTILDTGIINENFARFLSSKENFIDLGSTLGNKKAEISLIKIAKNWHPKK